MIAKISMGLWLRMQKDMWEIQIMNKLPESEFYNKFFLKEKILNNN